MKNQVIVSMYDSRWNWTICTIDNDTVTILSKSDRREGDSFKRPLTYIEAFIYDSILTSISIDWSSISAQLIALGYDLIVCEDGYVSIYKAGEDK